MEERIGVEVSRAARDRCPLGVAAFDLDGFKNVNDERGHEIGDRVLAWVGSVLAEQVRGVAVEATGTHNGRGRSGVSDTLPLSVSAGVAAGVTSVDVHALIQAADRAMYSASVPGATGGGRSERLRREGAPRTGHGALSARLSQDRRATKA